MPWSRRDKPLWGQNGPETLRFLVVDELHTFDGAQGADLALLLRRLKYRLGTPERHLVSVGSSATLGSGDEAAIELRRYAETIFGESFDTGAVIRETRKTANEVFRDPEYLDRPNPEDIRIALQEAEDLDQPNAARRLALCLFPDAADPDLKFLREGDPADAAWRISLGDRLLQHHLCRRTLKIIAEHSGPASLETIAAGLAQVRVLRDWAEPDYRALAELVVALVSRARSGTASSPRPLFNVRLQIWIREMSRMVTNLPRIMADGRRSEMELFHGLDLDRQALKRHLPVVNCNRCGATAHVGRLNPGSRSCWAPLEQLYEEFFDDNGGERIRLFYHESIDRMVQASGAGTQIVKGALDAESIEFIPKDHDSIEPGSAAPVWMYNPTDGQGRIDRTCPACGQSRGLLLFGMRAARLTTGITGTLYTSEQNEESPEEKPRFLMFSDSVQDAAHRAAVAETRNSLSVYQKSLFTALDAAESRAMTLRAVIEDIPAAHLDAFGADDFTALFISKEQTWRSRYQDLIRDGISISDPVFLEHMRFRLGWEYFVDLTYRAHFSHTLEVNGIAAADVPVGRLRATAERLSREFRNALPGAPEIAPDALVRFLSGVVQRMRQQGAVAHPYLVGAVATSQGGRGLNWFVAAAQMGLGRTGTLPAPNFRRGLAPIPITLQGGPVGFERITRNHASNWYRDWLFRALGKVDLRVGTDPDTIYPIVLNRLEADALTRAETGIDESIRGALVESVLEKRFLRALSELYGEGALTPQVLSGGRRGFVLRAGQAGAARLWTIEPQVQIDARFGGLPKKRIDFLLTPVGRGGACPIVIEMDGLEYHAGTVPQDLLDRLSMIRSRKVLVWTLSWRDLDPEDRALLNPLAEPGLGSTKIGLLSRVLADPRFSVLAGAVRAIQTDTALNALRRLLDGEAEDISPARSVLLRALVAIGRPLDQLPRSAVLSEEGRVFLLVPGLTEHIGHRPPARCRGRRDRRRRHCRGSAWRRISAGRAAMSGAERAGWRLAHRLAWRLAAVMLMAITLASVAVAWRSVATIRSLDDATLQSQARLVAGQLSAGPDGRPVLSMPAQLAAAFGADDGQSLFIVYDGRDLPTATSDPRASTVIAPFLPERPQRGFFKVPPSSVYEQGLVGVVIPAGPWRVVVAQAHEQNEALIESLIREFALSAAWLLLPIAAVTVGVGVLTIRHGLRTLREVSSAASLVGPHRPGVRLPVANLPGEIVPLVHAMNEALDRLERALETQRRFFGSAAHALRTPLAVLTARIDALPDSEAKRALRADTDRTTRLVGQLLSLARLEELPLDVSESVDLPDAAAEVIADLAPLAIGKGIELALTAGNQTRPVRGNRAAIILALSNLIDNAITYAPPGSVIDIVMTAPATIAVQDRGPGVAEGERSAIFARFHRARGARSGGSGLGLTIVAEIAAAHGGSVRLEQPEGGGATFVLHLGDRR